MIRPSAGQPQREAPEPLEGPVVGTVLGGTLVWFVLFLVLLPFHGRLDDDGHLWWLWTCLAGVALGLVGTWYVRSRAAAIARSEDEPGEAEDAAGQRDESAGSPDEGTGNPGDGPGVRS